MRSCVLNASLTYELFILSKPNIFSPSRIACIVNLQSPQFANELISLYRTTKYYRDLNTRRETASGRGEDGVEDRREPEPSLSKQLLHNPSLSDPSGVIISVQLEQRSLGLVVRRFIELLRPDEVTVELVDRRGPGPRAHGVVVRVAGSPLGLEDGLVARAAAGGRALDPRVGFFGPGLADTVDKDLADQRIVLVPVEVALDLGVQRPFPFGWSGFDGPLDDISVPGRMEACPKRSVRSARTGNKHHSRVFLLDHLT